ncbi:MAG: hypothetical protein QXL96_08020 [Ignisphaera sp.]
MSDDDIMRKLALYIDKKLYEIIQGLSEEEKKVLRYFIQNISVGGIIALRELKALYKVQDPKTVIRNLIDKGLLEQGFGCYNLAKSLREALFKLIQDRI